MMLISIDSVFRVSFGLIVAALCIGKTGVAAQAVAEGEKGEVSAPRWRMPPNEMSMPMQPGLAGALPSVSPFLPGRGIDPATLLEAAAPRERRLADGDTLRLVAAPLRRTVAGLSVILYGFNGQQPGPRLRVRQGSTVFIEFRNETELTTTMRWHGVRVDNRFDGVPGLTQPSVHPGESFVYEVRFDDAGVFWYHPHEHADIAQDLGLYGNLVVDSAEPRYYGPANREEFLILDDLQIDDRGLLPWGFELPNHALMGRFGNVLLVNGGTGYSLDVRRGEVVRFFLTNASNTRTFNVVIPGADMKLVAGDLSRFEREVRVDNVPIAPGERYVVDVRFAQTGGTAVLNRIQALDHFRAVFVPRTDTLGVITVAADWAEPDHAAGFDTLRENAEVGAEIDRFRPSFEAPVDHELVLSSKIQGLPTPVVVTMAMDTLYYRPVEWNDAMPMMNWLSTGNEVLWILHEPLSEGAEIRPAVGWRFRQGDIVKLRFSNTSRSLHPMHHPMHLHGQRFLVVERDGVRATNLAWKDTVLLPVGSTVDVLVDMANPGRWLLNCQIPEHLGTGMSIAFTVTPRARTR
ncbi:MAG: multicopper oxidase family protein [Gemmatimonadota bacterium]